MLYEIFFIQIIVTRDENGLMAGLGSIFVSVFRFERTDSNQKFYLFTKKKKKNCQVLFEGYECNLCFSILCQFKREINSF